LARRTEASASPRAPARTRDALAALAAEVRSVHRLHSPPVEDARGLRRCRGRFRKGGRRITRTRLRNTRLRWRALYARAARTQNIFLRSDAKRLSVRMRNRFL